MTKTTLAELQQDLDQVLLRGWQEFPTDKGYELTKDYFFELLHSSFFEQKFRGKIVNPAHYHAVLTISRYVNTVLIDHGVTLQDFYPGDFSTSTGKEITDDPDVPLYEHRSFHNKAWKDSTLLGDITITFCHVRGKFEFPKAPFVTIKEI